MNTAIFNIQFITPCFCGGADQARSEIRVPSIRGQLRWWYRALGGRLDQESRLFGSADQNYGMSKLLLRIKGFQSPGSTALYRKNTIQTRQGPKQEFTHEATCKYLWHFLKQQKRTPIPEESTFSLWISSKKADDLKQGIAAAAAWIVFGSLGARGRRGAGAMKLDNLYLDGISDENSTLKPYIKRISAAIRQPEIEVFFKSVWEAIRLGINTTEQSIPFSMRIIDRCFDETQGIEVVELMAKKWRELRCSKSFGGYSCNKLGRADHDETAALMQNELKAEDIKIRRAVMGMPYVQDFRRGPRIEWSGKLPNHEDITISRMSSPFHLRPVSVNNRLYPAVLIFDSVFHAENGVFPKSLSQQGGNKVIEKPVKTDTQEAVKAVENIWNRKLEP